MKNDIEKRIKRMKNEFNMRTMVVAILNDEIIGSIIFEYVINLFIENGKKKMGLWCLKENNFAISFYKKKGGIITTEKNLLINHNFRKMFT